MLGFDVPIQIIFPRSLRVAHRTDKRPRLMLCTQASQLMLLAAFMPVQVLAILERYLADIASMRPLVALFMAATRRQTRIISTCGMTYFSSYRFSKARGQKVQAKTCGWGFDGAETDDGRSPLDSFS
jgi:hypothetical protein